ncbi:MAG: HipA domain-containing protein [Actinobacteria bacterium]|nr:HipA domain-containing protein [Actinomycetota bacterium]
MSICLCCHKKTKNGDPYHRSCIKRLFYLADGKLCYIIKRFDRDNMGGKIHVEDMAQLMGLPSDSKYEASLEKVGSTILRFSKRPYLDLIDFSPGMKSTSNLPPVLQ